MKLSLTSLVVATSFSSAVGFAPCYSTKQKIMMAQHPLYAASPLEEVSDASSESSDPYERIGITKDELAIGVDESEFLQWIGT